MRISSLRYFYEVAQLKSISKVSKDLHISQPALSHQLFKLEKELGVTLFERSNRGVELTTKEINEPRDSYEMIELFKEKEKLIPKDKKNNINLYINLTQSYDPSNLLYSLFYEWQDSERRNIGILFMNEEHKKKLIKRMR